MTGTCPTCRQQQYPGTPCRRCGGPALPLPVLGPTVGDADTPRFIRRLLFGLVCVFGLFAGLDHALSALTLWTPDTPPPSEQVWVGVLLASCLIGCVIAGTGNHKAELTGLLVGVLAAAGHLWQLNRTGESLPGEWLFGFPIMAGLVGVMAGFAGRLIYPPAPAVAVASGANARTLLIEPPESHPVVMWRVLLGAALAVAGTYWAGHLQQQFARVAASSFGSFGGSAMVVWQLATITTLLGGVLAGANTKSGLKQGILAGVVTGLAVAALHLKFGSERPMGVDFWQEQLSVGSRAPALLGVLVGAAVLMGAVGGWLGSQLLRPKN